MTNEKNGHRSINCDQKTKIRRVSITNYFILVTKNVITPATHIPTVMVIPPTKKLF